MASKYTTIEVTQADIDRAVRNNSARCVVATAVARSVPGANRVEVDLQTIRFTVDGERRIYLTPPGAAGYVVGFDAGDPIHPFGFRLSEAHRVSVRQDKHTPASKERNRATMAVKRAKKKAAEAQQALELALAKPDADPVDVAAAEAIAKQSAKSVGKAAKSRAETGKRLAGQPVREKDTTPDPDTGARRRPAPRRAFRNNTRTYGGRTLRINQDKPTPENVAARESFLAVYNESTPDQST